MLKNLNYKLGQFYLISKIFARLVPYHLYWKVFNNTCKNILHIYSPSSAILGLTYRCQCKCIHCSAGLYNKDTEGELTTKEWFSLLNDISYLGVPRINITGGEALLRKDIFEIVEYAAKKFVVILESNGQMLTEENVKRFKKCHVSCIAVSIDSYDSSIHDNLRNLKGCFQNAVEGILNVTKNKIPCLLSTYVTSERVNSENIGNLIVLAKQLCVLAVRIMPPRPVGSFSCQVNSLLSEVEEQKIIGLIDPYLAYFKGMPAPKQCGVFNRATFYISPYGEIQLCPYLPLSFGNIREQSLPKLLERMWNHPIFKVKTRSCLILDADFRNKYIPQSNHNDTSYLLPIEV